MKILVATDGSKSSLQGVKYAAKLVGMLQGDAHSITLINVHDDTGLRHAKAFVGGTAVADYLRDLGEKDMKPARKVLEAANIHHDMVMRNGHTAQEIIDCAKDGKFDLIVMGSKGRGAVADLLIGSVAARVLAAAKPPVLLVK
jgi:nucleotide-binding universal stress UspA family protein